MQKADAKLAGELKNEWTDRHDDVIYVDGRGNDPYRDEIQMLPLVRNDYAWVYAGFDGSAQPFERNTKWDISKRQRFAEQWLHDSWRIKNNK